MCMCIYIYIYVLDSTYVYAYMYISVYIYIYVRICCMYTRAWIEALLLVKELAVLCSLLGDSDALSRAKDLQKTVFIVAGLFFLLLIIDHG